jgi:pimeloyl-ACP methyl ester carboxylesterase
MGGMIAQEFALQYPNRVWSLILGCTASGGPHAVPAESGVLQLLFRRDMSPEEAAEAVNPFIYDSATPRQRIDDDHGDTPAMVSSSRRIYSPTARHHRVGAIQSPS